MKYFIVSHILLYFFIGDTFFSPITFANRTIIPEKLAKKFYEHKIIPEFAPVLPYEICDVEYPNGISINPGDAIHNSTLVIDQPQVTWTCNVTNNYTVMFHNLDGNREMCELDSWLITNCAECNISRCDVVFSYGHPCPREGYNRFLFLVYEQKANVKYEDIMYHDAITRYIFRPRDYASSHFMGDPIAGNFFTINNTGRCLLTGGFLATDEDI